MKFEKKSIYEFVAVFLIILLVFVDSESYFSNLYYFIPIIWIVADVYDIYKIKKYLREKPLNEIRIRTKNDSYYNLLPFILGSILCLFSVLFYFITEYEKVGVIIYFIFGLSQILKGLNFLPSGLIKIENENLNYENGKTIKKIEVNKIKEFEISDEEIKFINENEEIIKLQHLELNNTEIKQTEYFLKKYID